MFRKNIYCGDLPIKHHDLPYLFVCLPDRGCLVIVWMFLARSAPNGPAEQAVLIEVPRALFASKLGRDFFFPSQENHGRMMGNNVRTWGEMIGTAMKIMGTYIRSKWENHRKIQGE